MYLGQIVEFAEAQELFEHPCHPYSKALFDASPLANPNLRDRSRIVLTGEIPSAVAPPSGCRFHPRCPYAQDCCKQNQPELNPICHESGHLSACPVHTEKLILNNSIRQQEGEQHV
jgi:oligopeptide/dipeptide ABC transporter ATP-binding protein